jgi:lysophospholipase L1-like esterase
VVIVGNSLTVGTFPTDVERYLGEGWQVAGRGISGQPTTEMLQDGEVLDRLRAPGLTNVLVVWEGTNDLFRGATAGQAYEHLRDYCEQRRRAGWRVVLPTILPRRQPDAPDQFESSRRRVNGWLLDRSRPIADVLVDLATEPLLTNPEDPRTFSDRVHLTPLGTSIVAVRVALACFSLTPVPDAAVANRDLP